jgi:hypothetical protein
MAYGDLVKRIQECSDSELREWLRDADPMSPRWSGINAELEWRASQEMMKASQETLRASQEMYRQTRVLVGLTWAIAGLTFALLVYTIVAAFILSPMR